MIKKDIKTYIDKECKKIIKENYSFRTGEQLKIKTLEIKIELLIEYLSKI